MNCFRIHALAIATALAFSAVAAAQTMSRDQYQSGKDGIAAEYKGEKQASYKLRVARAEAGYSVARERCDDSAGNVKDVCLKEAKAAEVAGKADAKARMKTANANNAASEKGAEARREAASAKRDADYAVAKEKCDTFAGDAKNGCLDNAKARFGKS